jgi:hypothetical protein
VGNDSVVGCWRDSRTEMAAWSGTVQRRRPKDMSGGLCSWFSYPAVCSHGVSRHLCFVERVEEPT